MPLVLDSQGTIRETAQSGPVVLAEHGGKATSPTALPQMQVQTLSGPPPTAVSVLAEREENTHEDRVDTEITFALETLDNQLVDLVERLCTPLFLLFNFARVEHQIYENIVSNFRNGIIR